MVNTHVTKTHDVQRIDANKLASMRRLYSSSLKISKTACRDSCRSFHDITGARRSYFRTTRQCGIVLQSTDTCFLSFQTPQHGQTDTDN